VRLVVISALLVAGGIVAAECATPEAPRPLQTVLVTNATCDSGGCRMLEIRAFVTKFRVPYPPYGEEVLGWVPPGTSCLTFPPSWRFGVYDQAGDTVWVTWTPSDTEPIYLIALDSLFFHGHFTQAQVDSSIAGIWPYDGVYPSSMGETPDFEPGDAPGWRVTFPSTPPWSANLVPDARCQ